MRWLWIDRFVEFKSGSRAVAVKHVTNVEPAVDEYLPGFPFLPPSLIVEGLAQTAGLLVGEVGSFRERVVLAKVGKAVFHELARTGHELVYTATIEDIQPDGAICVGTSHIEGRLQAEIELVFAHLDDRFPPALFAPNDLLVMLRLFGLYDVGVDRDGRPLVPPDYMLEAERAAG